MDELKRWRIETFSYKFDNNDIWGEIQVTKRRAMFRFFKAIMIYIYTEQSDIFDEETAENKYINNMNIININTISI